MHTYIIHTYVHTCTYIQCSFSFISICWGPALMAVWSKAPPRTARYLSPLPGFEYGMWECFQWLGVIAGYSGFLNCLQLASHELATIWHKCDEKWNSLKRNLLQHFELHQFLSLQSYRKKNINITFNIKRYKPLLRCSEKQWHILLYWDGIHLITFVFLPKL